MKNARQAEILNIVQNEEVETQEQLLAELKPDGPVITELPLHGTASFCIIVLSD